MRKPASGVQRVVAVVTFLAGSVASSFALCACEGQVYEAPEESPPPPLKPPTITAPGSASPASSAAVVGTAGPTAGPASPAPAPAAMRSVEITPAKVAEGKALFQQCAACHGEEGEGRTGIGPRLNSASFLAAASDAMLLRTISNGRAGTTMIEWQLTLKPEQIESLVAYIRSWRQVEPAELKQGQVGGDPAEGQPIFAQICAGCHGRTGAGYQETANGTGIGRRAFLMQVDNGYLRHIIKHGKDATKMRPFAQDSKVAVANLSDDQIENVIAYLRNNAW